MQTSLNGIVLETAGEVLVNVCLFGLLLSASKIHLLYGGGSMRLHLLAKIVNALVRRFMQSAVRSKSRGCCDECDEGAVAFAW